MMPVEHERDWTLVDIVHNLRVYCRTVSLNSHFVTLFACTTKIKASSTVCSLLVVASQLRSEFFLTQFSVQCKFGFEYKFEACYSTEIIQNWLKAKSL